MFQLLNPLLTLLASLVAPFSPLLEWCILNTHSYHYFLSVCLSLFHCFSISLFSSNNPTEVGSIEGSRLRASIGWFVMNTNTSFKRLSYASNCSSLQSIEQIEQRNGLLLCNQKQRRQQVVDLRSSRLGFKLNVLFFILVLILYKDENISSKYLFYMLRKRTNKVLSNLANKPLLAACQPSSHFSSFIYAQPSSQFNDDNDDYDCCEYLTK